MHKLIPLSLLLLLNGTNPIAQADMATVTLDLTPPILLEHAGQKQPLLPGTTINPKDRIISGNGGSTELQLSDNSRLLIKPNSSVLIALPLNILLQSGSLCITRPDQPDSLSPLILHAGMLTDIVIKKGQSCIKQKSDASFIHLIEGQIQIEHFKDKNTVILSEAGTKYNIDQSGNAKLIPSNLDELENISSKKTNTTLSHTPAISATGQYIVYLYSSQKEKSAQQVNKKLRAKGYPSRLYQNKTKDSIRYRVAIPGFISLQSAKTFSEHIASNDFGINNTWIAHTPD